MSDLGKRAFSIWHQARYETSGAASEVVWETTKPQNRAAWAAVERALGSSHPAEPPAAETEAWAVAVLDARLEKMPAWCSWEVTRESTIAGFQWSVSFTNSDRESLDGVWDETGAATPAIARLAAARALVAADPKRAPSKVEPAAEPVEGRWVPLIDAKRKRLNVTEGERYLFAVGPAGGWEYFSDSVIWDAESEPQWHDGSHGWALEDDVWFRPLPTPPAPDGDSSEGE